LTVEKRQKHKRQHMDIQATLYADSTVYHYITYLFGENFVGIDSFSIDHRWMAANVPRKGGFSLSEMVGEFATNSL